MRFPKQGWTWINEGLQFTHGYGLVMNVVSMIAERGMPQYVLKNTPPSSDYGLAVRSFRVGKQRHNESK